LIGREVTWLLGIRVAEHGKAESPSGTPNLLEWSGASLDQLREGPEEMDRSGQAVVLGGGVAGMLAARVLADTFEQVTIIERHTYDLAGSLDSGPQSNRRSIRPVVPQALSERARPQLERLFPNLSAELTADGAATGAAGDDVRLQFTQQFIKRHLWRRLTSHAAIATLQGRDAVGLVSNGERCIGVRILPRSHSAAARSITAELVVDAMGPGSRLCIWLDDIWRIRIPNDREHQTMHYASRPHRLRAGSLPDALVVDPPAPAVAAANEAVQSAECDRHEPLQRGRRRKLHHYQRVAVRDLAKPDRVLTEDFAQRLCLLCHRFVSFAAICLEKAE